MAVIYTFLSYTRSDGPVARSLHDRLEAAEPMLDVWWDQENRVAEDWTEQIIKTLRLSNAIVVAVSSRSVGSDGVKREVLLAEKFKRPVAAVLFEPEEVLLAQERCGLMYILVNSQWISAWGGQDPVPELVQFLRDLSPHNHSGSSQRPLLSELDVNPPRTPPRPTPQRARVRIVLSGNIASFDLEQQSLFKQLLAILAEIDQEEITIVDVQPGSIIVTLELPESTAHWLVGLAENGSPLIKALDAQRVEALPPLLAPSAPQLPGSVAPIPQQQNLLDRLFDWLRSLSAPRLAGATALLAVLVVAIGLAGYFRGSNGDALLLCGDLSLGAGRCPQGAQSPFFSGPEVRTTLRSPEDSIPQVITPRRSGLLSLTPTVRWTPIDGTTSYTVTLIRYEGSEPWTAIVTGTNTLTYPPAGAPALERGRTYRFEVRTAEGGPEEATSIGFNVASDEQAQAIETEAQELRDKGLDRSVELVLLANLYAQEGYYADALALLEPVAGATEQAAVELLLGNLYIAIGLPDLAIPPLERAAALAQAAGDRAVEALALARLGEALAVGGPDSQARARVTYERAISIYRDLGYDEQARQLAEQLAELP